MVMNLYKTSFAEDGHRILTSSNAAEAMAELQDEKVDLLVTDLVMPQANTFELFDLVREKFPKLPVIVVSGKYKDHPEDFTSKGYKVAAFMPKPVRLAALKAKINEVLGIVRPDGKPLNPKPRA